MSTSKCRCKSHALVDDWLDDISAKASGQEKGLQKKELQEKELQNSPVIESIEVPPSPPDSVAPSEAVDDQMSQRDSQTTVSERLDPSSSAY